MREFLLGCHGAGFPFLMASNARVAEGGATRWWFYLFSVVLVAPYVCYGDWRSMGYWKGK